MADANVVKQIRVGTPAVDYDIAAKYILSGVDQKSWSDIEALVGVGLQIVIDTATASGEPSTTASDETKGKLYLVQDAGAISGTYVEWITIDKGSSASPRYVWEKIGSTQTDLTNYAKKATITLSGDTSTGGASATGSDGAGSSDATGSAGGGTYDITISSTYDKVNATTGEAASATVSISASSNAGAPTATENATAHTHTMGGTSATISYLTGVTVQSATVSGEAATAGAHTHSITTSNHSHTVSSTGTTVASASYNNGILILTDTSVISAVGATTGNAGAETITSGSAGGHTHSVSTTAHTHGVTPTSAILTYISAIDTNTGSAGAHNHEIVPVTITISGTGTIAAHSHTISTTATTISGTGSITIAAHTHSYTKPTAHTHSIATHTHSVSVSGNNYNS